MIDDIRHRLRTSHASETEHDPVIINTDGEDEPATEPFSPPETIADSEETHPQTTTAAPLVKTHRSFFKRLRGLSKKQWIIIGVVAVLLLGGGGAAYALLHHPKATPVATVTKPKPKPKPVVPTTVASTLTGLQVDPSVNQLPVTGVMIENSTLARPQSGLNNAGVVFEAVAEGGITRFLALYQDSASPYLGPVRSVRPYYIQWALGFDAAIAHVGGSPEALDDMKAWNVKDLDQFYNGDFYQRISSRVAPHNVYTSTTQLNQLETQKGYGKANYTGFLRKKEAPLATPSASSIDFTISSSDYNVHYDYDKATNAYLRNEGGAPHDEIDQSGTVSQLQPKVVVALVMNQGIEADDLHTSYATIGSGSMYIFQDGAVTAGTWQKTSSNAQFTFTASNGQPLALNAGQTWITIVSSAANVAYKP
ncbi:MAG TPA: DUF3048 domain-containing protein [Candidatus Saccharimonadales bacterium]|nr:DUF3048 domain-containing protein [Candidatus Saccharimonadales bacterium]